MEDTNNRENERLLRLKNIVSNIPLNPGIYMMKNIDGTIIYVGKAKSLRKRVRQYFNKSPKTMRIQKMVSQIENIEYIITDNELEALVLECNYIKANSPKYNVMLKDDKTYPYIKITVREKYPRIYITRRKIEDKNLYFGPYTDVGAARRTVELIKEIFPIKRCKTNFEKVSTVKGPCLYYHIGRCLGPCINELSLNEYREMIDQVILFLNGNTLEIKRIIMSKISECVGKLEFEKAGKLKERLDSIDRLSLRQQADNINEVNSDIWAYVYKVEEKKLYVQVFKIRNYKIQKHSNITLDEEEMLDIENDVLSLMSQYYNSNKEDIPKKIYVKIDNEEETKIVSDYISDIKGSKVEVKAPKIGDKLKLIEMVEKNIKINIDEENNEVNSVILLQELLGLNYDLNSIEAYDISNLRNEYIVGAMIRFEDGKLNKKMYRKFKIKSTDMQNDPLCMAEVLRRRLSHHEEWALPDLILIDGGKTQLNAALEVLKEMNMEDIDILGMVKDDKHRTRGIIDKNGNEIDLSKKQEKNARKVLNFLTYLQDEVHRFVITYHKTIRSKGSFKSLLSNVDGLGSARINNLLKNYGSIDKIKNADISELTKYIPEKVAIELKKFLSDK